MKEEDTDILKAIRIRRVSRTEQKGEHWKRNGLLIGISTTETMDERLTYSCQQQVKDYVVEKKGVLPA